MVVRIELPDIEEAFLADGRAPKRAEGAAVVVYVAISIKTSNGAVLIKAARI